MNAGLFPLGPVLQEDLSVAGTAHTVCPLSSGGSGGGGGIAVANEGSDALPAPLRVPSVVGTYDRSLAPDSGGP